jgi:hypothetical protein
MSELRRFSEKLKDYYLNGFFLDGNTFLKADEAKLVMARYREEDGRAVEKPMIILKNVVEMMVDHVGKVVAVGKRPELAVWVNAIEHAVKRFNK